MNFIKLFFNILTGKTKIRIVEDFELDNFKINKKEPKKIKKIKRNYNNILIPNFSTEPPKLITQCEYPSCKRKINGWTRYNCPYCGKNHCEEHRLPEKHKCPNPRTPEYIKRNMGQKEDMDWFVD